MRTTNIKGFTLIELVLSIAIIGIVAMLVGPMLTTGIKGYDMVAKRRGTLTQARMAMDRICEELALIPDTDNIVAFAAGSITFNIPSENNITYTINGNNVTRTGAVISDSISSLAFTYLDANGNQTAIKANIKRIGVEIAVTAGAVYGTLNLRSQVFPRRFSGAYVGFQ